MNITTFKMPASRNEAEELLANVALGDLDCRETHRGLAWTATLRLDEVVVLRVENAGRGASNFYTRPDDVGLGPAWQRILNRAAELVLGRRDSAALDLVVNEVGDDETLCMGAVRALRTLRRGLV